LKIPTFLGKKKNKKQGVCVRETHTHIVALPFKFLKKHLKRQKEEEEL
jgi:transposase